MTNGVRNYLGMKKVYIGTFSCPDCPGEIKGLPFIVDDMEIYCDKCNTSNSMMLTAVKLKIPVEYKID